MVCFLTTHPIVTLGVAVTTGVGVGYLITLLMKKKTEGNVNSARITLKSFESANPLVQYAVDHSLRLLPVQKKLKDATQKHPLGRMMGAPEITQLLQNLTRMMNAKKVIEVGVFTGCTALGLALVLPADGKVIACDINDEFLNIGRPFWREAGVEDKICVKIQPAVKTLDELLANGEAGTFDLAFIDADKPGYDDYYEKCLQLLRKGGIIAFDNVLMGGSVLKDNPTNSGAISMKILNKKLKADPRIDISMLLIGDGLTLAFKL